MRLMDSGMDFAAAGKLQCGTTLRNEHARARGMQKLRDDSGSKKGPRTLFPVGK